MAKQDNSSLNTAIVGAGLMGYWHAKTIASLGAKLISIADSDKTRAESLNAKMGASASVFTNVDALLAGPKLDIAHVCTPADHHFEVARQLLDAGVHVVVEKPVTATLEQTRTLLNIAQEHNASVCPVHQFGFQDGVLATLPVLDSLGDLLNIRFTTASAGGTAHSEDRPNEIIADIIPHPLSVLQQLRPGINLDTHNWHSLNLHQGELQVIGDADGIGIDIYISMNARPTRCEMELFCTRGRVYLNFFHGYAVIEKGSPSRTQKLLQPFKFALKESLLASRNIVRRGLHRELAYPGLAHLLNRFYQAIITGTAPPVPAQDVLAIAVAREDLSKRFLQTRSATKTH